MNDETHIFSVQATVLGIFISKFSGYLIEGLDLEINLLEAKGKIKLSSMNENEV
jgi:hypothetical protein